MPNNPYGPLIAYGPLIKNATIKRYNNWALLLPARGKCKKHNKPIAQCGCLPKRKD